MSNVAAVILAAGAGRRLGGVNKALLETDGASFLATIARLGSAAGLSPQLVVVGEPHCAATVAEAERLGLTWLVNSDPSRGMASSIEVGFGHLVAEGAGVDAALLWPVDHARVRPATVDTVVAACTADNVVVPAFGGRGGHPTGFGRCAWPALARCSQQPEGARSVVHAAAQLRRVDVDDPGVLRDVDTPADQRCLP